MRIRVSPWDELSSLSLLWLNLWISGSHFDDLVALFSRLASVAAAWPGQAFRCENHVWMRIGVSPWDELSSLLSLLSALFSWSWWSGDTWVTCLESLALVLSFSRLVCFSRALTSAFRHLSYGCVWTALLNLRAREREKPGLHTQWEKEHR